MVLFACRPGIQRRYGIFCSGVPSVQLKEASREARESDLGGPVVDAQHWEPCVRLLKGRSCIDEGDAADAQSLPRAVRVKVGSGRRECELELRCRCELRRGF